MDSQNKNKLNVPYLDSNVESWGNNTTLIDATDELNNDLSRAVIVENLEFTDVAFGFTKFLKVRCAKYNKLISPKLNSDRMKTYRSSA